MRLVLILMVRNEEKILRRCLEAVEGVVDAFCIHDTGSTDKTREIAEEFLKTREGCLTRSTWRDFGHNRTLSFRAAQKYAREVLGWDTKETYGLLLDADMVFVPGSLRQQTLTEKGYTIVQCGGHLEYPNCRLVRFDHDWVCRGVTHEYWDGPTEALPRDVCHIDDRNDGGCKSDKFERDARLLEQGLRDEPDNVRYMFYLAQTYHSLGRWKDAIAMYKKRIAGGGWAEEVWYSHYMIAQSHKSLGNIPKFEEWMLRAYNYRPGRAESIYKLAQYFREVGQHYKAYHYVLQGKKIPRTSDSLFIEKDVYAGLFDYEASILDYYVGSDGLASSIRYLCQSLAYASSVLSNLSFYVKPIGGQIMPLVLPSPFGPDYRPSAVSVHRYPYANVRYVNYWIDAGDYKTAGGPVKTENAYVNLDDPADVRVFADASTPFGRNPGARVQGLEDIRVYDNRFTSTFVETEGRVAVVQGSYDPDTLRYDDARIMASPEGRTCEKNWLPVPGTDDMIYDWHPLKVGRQAGDTLVIDRTHATPPLFALFRGSAPPVRVGDEMWTLIHLVNYSKPRKYYHAFVALGPDYRPRRFTLPFVFASPEIEYCVCVRVVGDTLECYTSFADRDPARVTFPQSALTWVNLDGR